MITLFRLALLAPPPGGDAGQNPIINLIPFVLIIIVFYFFLIRPQQQKQKEREQTLDTLKKGDRVVTIGGLHGRVFSIDADRKTVTVQANDVKLTFDRTAIATIEKGETNDKLEPSNS